MTRRSDEVEQRMDAIVPESGIPLDARFFGQDVVVLAFQIAHDLGEAAKSSVSVAIRALARSVAYLASLSIWSPKPGVSTMVSDIRVPSSSSSSSTACPGQRHDS